MTLTTTPKRFTHPEAWSGGGGHGLTLRYAGPSTARLRAARDALWTFPGLEGCWRRKDREPAAASRIRSPWGLDLGQPLFGFAHVPGTGGIACRASADEPLPADEEHCPLCALLGPDHDVEAGWLRLNLPFGGLGLAFPIGAYPEADGSSLAWRDGVDDWLRALAEHVHRVAPFDLALVGWTDGSDGSLPLRAEDVPDQRWLGFLVPGPDGLAWFPPTMGAPIAHGDC